MEKYGDPNTNLKFHIKYSQSQTINVSRIIMKA